MITEIPSADDFREAGLGFLNLAWEASMSIELERDRLAEFEDAEFLEPPTPQQISRGQRTLATSIALAHTGIEFLLKARIADRSPYLLISDPPRSWPRGCDVNDVAFSDFRTPDAQDLVRLHDTVAQERLPDTLKASFDALRKQRNKVFHTVDKSISVTLADVAKAVMEAAHSLVQPHCWFKMRGNFLKNHPNGFDWSAWSASMNMEVTKTVETLKPSDLKRLTGFDKKAHRYLCVACGSECRDYIDLISSGIRLAQLRPNNSTSKRLFCFACQQEHAVFRVRCRVGGCRGNVLMGDDDYDRGTCVTCGEHNAIDEDGKFDDADDDDDDECCDE